MKKNLFFVGIVLLVWFCMPSSLLCAQSAEEVLEKANLFGNSRFLKMQVQMEISTTSGDKNRAIDINISNTDESYMVYMQITSPPFLRKMKYLQHKPRSGRSVQWVSTSRGAKKITSSGNDERIFDSDFTAADFASTSIKDYNVVNLVSTTRNSISCYKLELEPLESEPVWNKKVLYVEQDSFLIHEVEYFTDESLVKSYRILETITLDGKLFPSKSIMENYREGTFTKLDIESIELPESIPDRMFHYRNL